MDYERTITRQAYDYKIKTNMEVQNEIDHSMYQGCRGIFWALIACVFLFSLLAYHSCSGQGKIKLAYALLDAGYKSCYSTSRVGKLFVRPVDQGESISDYLCNTMPDSVEWMFMEDQYIILRLRSYNWERPCKNVEEAPVQIATTKKIPKKRRKRSMVILPPPDDMLNTKLTIYDR